MQGAPPPHRCIDEAQVHAGLQVQGASQLVVRNVDEHSVDGLGLARGYLAEVAREGAGQVAAPCVEL